jgi:5'-nucleotidase
MRKCETRRHAYVDLLFFFLPHRVEWCRKSSFPLTHPNDLKGKTRMKKILYIDMDGVLVDFQSALQRCAPEILKEFGDHPDDIPGLFAKMKPMDGALEAFSRLAEVFDVYILSTAPWNNPSAWSDKLNWVKTNLGQAAYKRLIITHHKNLNRGDFIVDDRDKRGVDLFEGEWIQFRSSKFPDWSTVVRYLLPKATT